MVDLSGLHLLLTRPESQAKSSMLNFASAGAGITCHPFLIIAPLQEGAEVQAAKSCLAKLDEYQKIIFVSQNAVRYGIEWIDYSWPQLPIGLKFFAIGKTTADQLQKLLSHLDASVRSPCQAMNSEDLLTLPALQSISGEKILIARGRGGRTHLAEGLRALGASVDYCELYQRQIPDTVDVEKLQKFRRSSETSIAIVLSGETLFNMRALLIKWSPEYWRWLKTQVLVVPGQRVAKLALQQNFQVVLVAKSATEDNITGAINDWRQKTGQ
ncbi:MAG: uroporphyrinogen-III synthase [Cellvibrionaceae bacterium]|jgi:uroporphyrinogen-III synthase